MADNDVAIEGRVRSYLADSGGSVADPGGRGLTDEMARAIGLDKPSALSALLGQMESDGVITREMRGLRTFRITLAGADAPPAAAPAPDPPVAGNGADTGGGRQGGRVVTLRDAEDSRPAPVADPPTSAGRAVSLRDALSRKRATEPPTAETVAADPIAADPIAADPSAADPSAADPTAADPSAADPSAADPSAADPSAASPDASPSKAVSLREALSRKAEAVVSAPPEDRPTAAPEPVAAAPRPTTDPPAGRALSLRDALAAGAGTAAPAPPSAPAPPDPPAWSGSQRTSLRDTAKVAAVAEWAPVGDDIAPKGGSKRSAKSKTEKAGKAEKAARVRRPRRQLTLPTPAVKTPPSKIIVTAVAVAMAGLVLIAVILVVVARGSSHHVPVSETTPLSSDACAVVTPELATAAFGAPAGVAHFVLGECVYDNGNQELIAEVFRQNAKALFDAGNSSTVQNVPGIGDGAYYADGRLRVLKGSDLLELAIGPVPAASPTPKLLALARSALQAPLLTGASSHS